MFANCLNLSAIVLVDSVITSLEGAVLATGLDANDSLILADFCFFVVPVNLNDSANVLNTNYTSLTLPVLSNVSTTFIFCSFVN
jgi:hypothetical protein